MAPEKVALTDLITTEKQLQKQTTSLDQGGYNPHPTIDVCSSSYCSSSAIITGISDGLTSGNPIAQVRCLMHGTTCVNQVMGDIYKCDNVNKFFILLHNRDHHIAEELQKFLNNKD